MVHPLATASGGKNGFPSEHRLMFESEQAFGVVRRQVDEGPLLCERGDLLQCLASNAWIGTDAVYFAFEKKAFGVTGVAGEQIGGRTRHNHRYVMWRVARRGNDRHIAFSGEWHGLAKWAHGLVVEVDEFRLQPFRPTMWQVTSQPSADTARSLPFLF